MLTRHSPRIACQQPVVRKGRPEAGFCRARVGHLDAVNPRARGHRLHPLKRVANGVSAKADSGAIRHAKIVGGERNPTRK